MTSPIPSGRRTSVYELPPRPRTKTEWLGALLLGAVFFVSGALILAHRPLVVERFLEWGYPTKWMTVVGAIEVLAAVLLVIPRFARHGAMILIVMMLGATFTHFAHGEYFAAIVPLTLRSEEHTSELQSLE